LSQILDFFSAPLIIEPAPRQLSGDSGLLAIRPSDQRRGLPQAFADARDATRDPERLDYPFVVFVRFGVFSTQAEQPGRRAGRPRWSRLAGPLPAAMEPAGRAVAAPAAVV
jgi:hypothetical protein